MSSLSCTYDKQSDFWCSNPQEAIVTDSVGLGESLIYLNGQQSNWKPIAVINNLAKVISYGCKFEEPLIGVFDIVALDFAPIKAGKFSIYTLDNYLLWGNTGVPFPDDKVLGTFANIVDEDQEGWRYKISDLDQSFLQIDAIDTVNTQVRGRFRIKFCLADKNGYQDEYILACLPRCFFRACSMSITNNVDRQ